jgi:PhzF family phenazine biosynthesis protein
LWANEYVDFINIQFESLAGPLFVTLNADGSITMDFPQKPITPCPCPTALQQALVQTDGTPVAIESVYRDDAIFVVVLKNPTDLLNLKPNLALIEQLDCRAVSVTSEGLDGHDFQSRYFAPRVGINEDPVCGSSHARLGLLWQDRLGKSHLRAYQASARSGTLSVDVTEDRILLTSHAVTVFNGEMDLGAQVCVANSAEQSADEAKSTRRAA